MDGSPHIAAEAPSPETPAGKHAAVLDRLVAIGMQIAERLGEDVKAADTDAGKIALDFARVARAVRQTVALDAMLADQARVRAESEKLWADEAREELEDRCPWLAHGLSEDEYLARQEGAWRKGTATHLVRRAIKAEAPDRDARERLDLDFQERLADEPDLFLTKAPLDEVIAGVCADLGLAPDWSALPKKDWDGVELEVKVALKSRAEAEPADEGEPGLEPAHSDAWDP